MKALDTLVRSYADCPVCDLMPQPSAAVSPQGYLLLNYTSTHSA